MKNINGDALRKKAMYLDKLGEIYNVVAKSMQWDCMIRTDEQDDNGDYIFKEPVKDESDGYYMTDYEKYTVYQDVLEMIEKMAK